MMTRREAGLDGAELASAMGFATFGRKGVGHGYEHRMGAREFVSDRGGGEAAML
jgi:hypothetical protein